MIGPVIPEVFGNQRIARYLLLALICLLAQTFVFWPAAEQVEYQVYDFYSRYLAEYEADTSIVLVEIDNATVSALSYPLQRDHLALLIKHLDSAGAAVVAVDVLLDRLGEGPEENNSLLAWVIKRSESLVLSIDFEGVDDAVSGLDHDSWNEWDSNKYLVRYSYGSEEVYSSVWTSRRPIAPMRQFLSDHTRLGHIKVKPGKDGKCREVPLVVSHGPRLFSCLALETALALERFDRLATVIRCDNDVVTVSDGDLQFSLPAGPSSEILVRYVNSPRSFYPRIAVLDLLEDVKRIEQGKKPVIPLSFFSGKVALIGQTAVAAADFSPTPISNNERSLYILANAIQNIVAGEVNRVVPESVLVVAAVGMSLVLLGVGRRLSALQTSLVHFLAMLAVCVLSLSLWYWQWMFLPPLRLLVIINSALVLSLLLGTRSVELATVRIAAASAVEASYLSRKALIASVVHRLRNSLALATYNTRLLTRKHTGDMSDKALELLDQVGKSIELTASNIDSLASYEKIEQEKASDKVDIGSVLREVVLAYGSQLNLLKVKLVEDCPTGVFIEVNKQHLHLIFDNLVRNSLDAFDGNENHNVKIVVKTEEDVVKISYVDDGPGISKEVLLKLGMKIVTTKPSTGLGIGVMSVYEVVRVYGGHISYSSESGQGTSVTISLPQKQVVR